MAKTTEAVSNEWLRMARAVSAVLVLFGASACGAKADPGSDSTTHFWRKCERDAECGSGQQCFCGRCTKECRGNVECDGPDAECVEARRVLSCELDLTVCTPSLTLRGDLADNADAEFISPSHPTLDAAPSDVVSEGAESTMTAPMATASSGNEGTPGDAAPESVAVGPTANVEVSSVPLDATSSAGPGETTTSATPPLPIEELEVRGIPWWMWAGDQPEVATGCVPLGTDSTPNTCEYSWSCAEHEYLVSCTENNGGGFDCYCSYPEIIGVTGYFVYQVPTDNSASACQAAFDACTTPHEAQQCTIGLVAVDEVEPYYTCQWESDCRTSSQNTGLEVAYPFAREGACIDENGHSYCTCQAVNLHRSYVVTGATGSDACALAAAACDADAPLTAWEYPECTTQTLTDSDFQCMVKRDCPMTAELSSQVSALALLSLQSQCYLTEVGNTESDLDCYCANEFGRLAWHQPGPNGANACLQALNYCDVAQDIVFGPPECGGLTGENTTTSCSRQRLCTSVGLVGDQELPFYTYVSTGCQRNTNSDPWSCACNAGENYESSERSASLTATQACDEYQAHCEPLITFTPAPVPLP